MSRLTARTTVRVVVAGVGMTLALAACQPTGDIRCDRYAGIVMEVDSHGWTTDCAPDYPNRGGDGQAIYGWADHDTKTVVLWPNAMASSDHLRKVMWHELAHVRGITDETDADRYAYCREPISGIGYRAIPTEADCHRLGAR